MDTYRLKVRGWQKAFHTNGNKKTGVEIFTSDKIDFKTKIVLRDKEGHYIMIVGSIQEEDICTQHRSTSICKQILTTIKGETDSNIIIVMDFNTPLSSMDISSRQKINKEPQALNDTLDNST